MLSTGALICYGGAVLSLKRNLKSKGMGFHIIMTVVKTYFAIYLERSMPAVLQHEMVILEIVYTQVT